MSSSGGHDLRGGFGSRSGPLLWILVLISTAGGGRIHLDSLSCFWVSDTRSSWSAARDCCQNAGVGGDLAAAGSVPLQTFIRHSFPAKETLWVWLKGSGDGASEPVGLEESASPPWLGLQQGCSQMALGTRGHWRTARCDGRYRFICEGKVTGTLPPDSYLAGSLLLSGVYPRTQMNLLPTAPDTRPRPVEMLLFPGLWFSLGGQLVSVELVVQPGPESSLARVQILRPYCQSNQHLVPPGCGSVMNPFSCCSEEPLCNTTGGCGVGRYWCHLLETCVPNTSPCSPYGPAPLARTFALPPRYVAIPPFYHVAADLPFRIEPNSELETISLKPRSGIALFPDDIVAIQHTRSSGGFLYCLTCDAAINSGWCQSYLSLSRTGRGGWWEGGLTSLPHGGQWVDGVLCDLKLLYVDTLHGGATRDDLTAVPTPRPEFRLNVIHPAPDERNQIHVRVNVPTLIVVEIRSAQRSTSAWSAPVRQSGVPFVPSCPDEVAQTVPGCRRQSPDTWFSSVTLVLPSLGDQTLNVSAMDAVSASVTVCGYEAVTGLSVEPHGPLRVLVDTSQSFTAKVERGSSVNFTWVIDGLEKFAYEGERYSVAFKKPAEYHLKVTASNPVSSESREIHLTADEMMPLAEAEFLFVKELIAVDSMNIYTVRVKVDVSVSVTFRWDFGDDSNKVIHTHTAPYQTTDGLLERGEKQVNVQDSVNHTYNTPGDFTLHVQIHNQHGNNEASIKIRVRPRLSRLFISSSPSVPLVKQSLLLEASVRPSAYGVVYRWDFGDGSTAVHSKVSHTFGAEGIYNVTVRANNSLTELTTWLILEVMEKISGLTISHNGPSEVDSATVFSAYVATGTSLSWTLDFGDGSLQRNLTGGSISHFYKSPGNYTVCITVSNSISSVHQSTTVEVYKLAISDILPTECIMAGKDTQFTALVNGDAAMLTFQWAFRDESASTSVTGQSTTMHRFPNHGIFPVGVTVLSSVTSVSFNTSICVEAAIANVSVQTPQDFIAVGERVCFEVLIGPDGITGSQFEWRSSSWSESAITENPKACFVYEDEGVEEVSVTASNKVSNKTAKVFITVQKPVSRLSLTHGSQSTAVKINAPTSFWVAGCAGTNVSVLWDFGDGSPLERNHNVSHVFTAAGRFRVTATALNAVSRESASLNVTVSLPVSDLSLRADQPYTAVGEETLITAVSSGTSGTRYYWTVDGVTEEGTDQFRFVFTKPGAYRVSVTAQNLVSRREAAVLIEVYERIEGLHIQCEGLTNRKYIPTREDLLFTVSITKGSNVTYNWLATPSNKTQQITGDGAFFRLFAETPGTILVNLRASNKLGETTSGVSVVAVERITSAPTTAPLEFAAVGKSANISVPVLTGSDLQYLWYVDSDRSPRQTRVRFLVHTFTRLGQHLVRVSVQNALSRVNITKQFLVQDQVGEVDFQIDGKTNPFYINTSVPVLLHGLILKGTDLHWDWIISDSKASFVKGTNQTLVHNFPHAGIYQVSLNVSNGITWRSVSHRLTVQEAIKGLMLNISKSRVCSDEEVVFVTAITKGTNVSYFITFKSEGWSRSQDIVQGKLTTSSLPAGRHLVTVKAWNLVSSVEVSSSIWVVERIRGLRLVNCCSAPLEALKENLFKAEAQTDFPARYTWIFIPEGSEPSKLTGQEVIFSSPESGSLFVSVMASDGVCSQTLNETAAVERPVTKLQLVCESGRIFSGYSVTFSVKVNGGSSLRYLWDFGDSTEASVTEYSAASHTYESAGNYKVIVKAHNNISNVSTKLHIEVKKLECSSPQVSLVQSPSAVLRSRQRFFEATVGNNCSAYKTKYLWEMFRESDCASGSTDSPGNKVVLSNQTAVTSLFLQLPKHTLEVGPHCLVFTVSFQGTPLFVQQMTKVIVVHSPLVAAIKGGSHRLWTSLSDLILDGSESRDPDVEPGEEDKLQYHWTFTAVNSTKSHFGNQPVGNKNSRMTVLSTQLEPGTVYIFTLTVRKAGRKPASVTQTVSVCDAPVLPVIAECVSCFALSFPGRVSYSSPIILSGQCGQCDGDTLYKWSARDQSGATLELDEFTTSRGRCSPDLVVRSHVLQHEQSYTFTLSVSQPGRQGRGSGSLTVTPNLPPHGGRCDLSPGSEPVRLLETVVAYNCSGWQDDDAEASQLMYTFQVVPCQPVSAVCPVLMLYRGTRSAFGSLVPMGNPAHHKDESVITVTLLVEDHLGAKVIGLNRTLTVESPTASEVATLLLRNKSQTELWGLVQHGNPQEIIPYSVALMSQLNQMASRRRVGQLIERRQIRGTVTRSLASLPISCLMDVDQISSALAQSTAVPGELVCDDCQEMALEAVDKMIHVLDTQRAGFLSAVDTGRNILNIIGSTLAAGPESVRASRPHRTLSTSRTSAAVTSLSALGRAGDLVRSLMRLRLRGEAPLSLSNPYINIVGFQGDPSDLLCTQSTQSSARRTFSPPSLATDGSEASRPCRFHIPSSLTARLRSNRSEVVQILFGTDSALESNPLLATADPPISTTLVAMELTTPQGEAVTIQDLAPGQAIRVTLPNKYPVRHDGMEGELEYGRTGEGSPLGITVTLPAEGRLDFTVKAVDELDENTGLYLNFNFSLAPGATPLSLGHVTIDVGSAVTGTNGSHDSPMRQRALSLSASTTFTEETIFLSPLLKRTAEPLSIGLTSSLAEGGPVRVTACVFSSLCRYYSVEETRWSSEGLQPLEGSTLHEAHCLTKHLTMFGASLFVHPGAVVLLPPAGDPMRNTAVAIVCSVLVLTHLLVGLIAHKLDHLDSRRQSQVPLCGRPGLYHYRVLVKTGRRPGAGTTAHVGVRLYGENGSGSRHLQREGSFQRGSLDHFHLETDDSLGEVWKIRIWHDNTGLDPAWYLQHVVVWDRQTDHMFFFVLEDWLSVENQRNGTVEKEILASCPEELSEFRRVFCSQLLFGIVERHLWLSLWERPAHSRFTRGQRVTCSAVLLHLYLALAALWYGAVGTKGQSGPVSTQLLLNVETVAVGMTIAALVFPLQCFLCFLFRKVDKSDPRPVCHSVEMDVYLEQSDLSGPSFLSLPDSCGPVHDSPASESKALDSSILDFWTISGLVPQKDEACQEEFVATWPSCESLLNLPAAVSSATMPGFDRRAASSALIPTRVLQRKKALTQLRPVAADSPSPSAHLHLKDIPSSRPSPSGGGSKLPFTNLDLIPANNQNLTTIKQEDLLMSIAAEDATKSNSDSGRDSPRTTSSLATTRRLDQSESLHEVETDDPDPQFCSSPDSLYEERLYKCPSVLSVDSVASTFLPSPPPDPTRSSSATRIGVARGEPGCLLPPWVLRVIYILVAALLGGCLAVVGLYGSQFSGAVLLMWLASALSAFLTSALLLEPLKVFVQALLHAALRRPVDPEVEDQLAQDTSVVRALGEHAGKVRPPCGYGLLQAKEEARKIRALQSLMRHCVWQLFFLLLVLMVNHQDSVEAQHGRLLHSAVGCRLRSAPLGIPNLTSLRDWSDAQQWINLTLVPHLHQTPTLGLVGRPRLESTHAEGTVGRVFLGNSSAITRQVLADLHMAAWSSNQFKILSIKFTQYHRDSALFACVSIKLEWAPTQRISASLSISPLLIPPSISGPGLQVALTVLLLISALLMLFGEMRSMAAERVQYLWNYRRWFQLLLALLSLATTILQLCFFSWVTFCFSELRSKPDKFINFHRAALLAQMSSQFAAVLLTLLILQLLGTLRFVRRWVVIGRVLWRSRSELWPLMVLLLLLLMLCAHLGNMLFSSSMDGFLSLRWACVSVLSMLRGRAARQRLCWSHPVLGPLYGLLLTGGGLWILARLCGIVLINTHRAEQPEMYRPATKPQDYEMMQFFLKRLKLWMGLMKAKEFRHRVKFEGMDIPPSRSSQESQLSTVSSTLPSFRSTSLSSSVSSPCLLSSALSVRSEDSSAVAEPAFNAHPSLDRLLPCVSNLLSCFDRINQITEDIHDLEIKLEDIQTRRINKWISKKKKSAGKLSDLGKPMALEGSGTKTPQVRQRKMGFIYPRPRVSLPSSLSSNPSKLASSSGSVSIFPRTRSSYSDSESALLHSQSSNKTYPAGSPGFCRFTRRRAWHSGSSHSADAIQKSFQSSGGVIPCGNGDESLAFTNASPSSEVKERRRFSRGAPVKRKAWIFDGPENEHD